MSNGESILLSREDSKRLSEGVFFPYDQEKENGN